MIYHNKMINIKLVNEYIAISGLTLAYRNPSTLALSWCSGKGKWLVSRLATHFCCFNNSPENRQYFLRGHLTSATADLELLCLFDCFLGFCFSKRFFFRYAFFLVINCFIFSLLDLIPISLFLTFVYNIST